MKGKSESGRGIGGRRGAFSSFTLIELLACHPKPWRRKVQAGFTLIELLVVIAIIAILASLLMPSLKRSRQLARQVACANHIKQIFIALEMYRNDNNERLPSTTPTQFAFSGANGVIVPRYMDAVPMCPETFKGNGTGMGHGVNYWVLKDFGGPAHAVPGSRLLPDGNPAPGLDKIALISDCYGPIVSAASHLANTWDGENGFQQKPQRHGNGLNFGFMDGHVEHLARGTTFWGWTDAADSLESTFSRDGANGHPVFVLGPRPYTGP